MRPGIGGLIFGLFLGWTGFVKWAERAAWLAALVVVKAHPWDAEWTTSWNWNWIVTVGTIVGLGMGFLAGTDYGKYLESGE